MQVAEDLVPADGQIDGGQHHGARGHAHGRQGGHAVGRRGDVVEAGDREVVGHAQTTLVGFVEHAHGEHIGGGHDGRGRFRQLHQLAQRGRTTAIGVDRVATVLVGRGQAVAVDGGHEGVLTLGDVTQPSAWAGEPDARMAEADEVVDDRGDTAPVVDRDGGDAAVPRAVPQGDHRDARVLQLLDEARSIAQVAEEEESIAVTCFEDAGQRLSLLRALVGMAQDHVVAAFVGLQRRRLDGAGEEGIGDVTHDHPKEHRGRAAQAACEGVGPVTQLAGGLHHALPRGLRDGHGRGRAAEHA